MRIVIDMQGAQTASRYRGIGRYTTALTRGILRNAGRHDIWIVLNGALEESVTQIRADLAGHIPHERIRVFETPGRIAEIDARGAPRRRAAEMLREQFIALLAPDLVLVTSLFEGFHDDAVGSVGTFIDGARTAVILYDLIPLLNPASYLDSPYLRQCYMRKIASLQRAGLLLSISDYAREEAIAALGLPPERVVAISTAVDESFVPAALEPDELDAVRRRFGITRRMLMCAPGGFDPRKNIQGLMTAYSLLPRALRESHQLVLASHLAEAQQSALLAHAGSLGLAASDLVLTGYLDDADLVALYQAADLFVFPSLHEGFGLPALEAMACGTPTIASNTTSLPEVIGLDEALFDPAHPQSIADRIARVLTDSSLYERLRRHSRTQAAKFSWDATAERALRALERHAVMTPATPARSTDDLMQALVAVEDLPGDEQTLVQLASCVAAFPDLAAPSRLFVDLGHIPPGTQGAPEGLGGIGAIPDLCAAQSAVRVALSASGGVWHYRHAPANGTSSSQPGPVADMRTCDRLVIHAGTTAAHRAAWTDGLYASLYRLGVQLYIVADGIPGTPDGADNGLAWFGKMLGCASGVICTSQAVAEAFAAWCAAHEFERRLPPFDVAAPARLA